MARKRSVPFEDEPTPAGEEWLECGGQLIWAAGSTPAGFPYGVTLEEFRESSARFDHGNSWVWAKEALAQAARTVGDPGYEPHIGWVKKVGQGLSRDIFAAEVELRIDGELRSPAWAVLLARREAPPDLNDRARREAVLLARLRAYEMPFRLPRAVAVVDQPCGLALVRDFLPGIEADLRAGRMPGLRPWALVGKIAAAIHGWDVTTLADSLPGHETRRASARARLELLQSFDSNADPLVTDAIGWAREHLPPPDHAALVHGDLLGQNILLHPKRSPAVIDWEFAHRGDPAYDQAIVSRGVRHPFQLKGGLQKLLAMYNRHALRPLSESEVRFHEICLHLAWYGDAIAGRKGLPLDQVEARLRNLMRAVESLR